MDHVTLKDIAKRAEVSVRTVSRVINQNPEVNPSTRERVLQVIKELDYHPNSFARRLSTGSSKTVGLCVPLSMDYLSNDLLFLEIILGLSSVFAKEDMDLQIYTTDFQAGQQKEFEFYIRLVREARIEGLILMDPQVEDDLVLELQRNDIPFVLIGRPGENILCDYVDNDNVKGAFDLVDYLAGLGHERIALIPGPAGLTVTQDRILGYRKGLNKNRLPERAEYVLSSQFTQDSGVEQVKRLLGLPRRPTAVITGNDLLAVGAIQGAREMGVKVPEELSVASFNDTPLTRYYDPSITVMHWSVAEEAGKAAEMLLARLRGKPHERLVVVPCDLVVRRSTAAPPERNSG